ncbi:MAG: hypothetical protein R3D52_15265 [Xanthobacteraceae bacterium]
MSDVIVAPSTRDLDELAGQLGEWLGGKLPAASDIRIDNLTYPRGAGQSHETILFDAHWSEGGEACEQGCVVRIKPSEFTVFVDTLFEEQYQVMKVISDGGYVKVAKPLWFEEDLAAGPAVLRDGKARGARARLDPALCARRLHDRAYPGAAAHALGKRGRSARRDTACPARQAGLPQGPPGAEQGLEQEWDKYERGAAWVQDMSARPRSGARWNGSSRSGPRTVPRASSGETRASAT